MRPFVPWSAEHVFVIALTFLAPLALGIWARRDASGRRARRFAFAFAVVLLVQMFTNLFTVGLEEKHRWAEFMPLHLCHFALFACVTACLVRDELRQLPYELAYFWGLAGTLQGVLTPGLKYGFPSREFILFFLGHSGIVACVVFLTTAFSLRPHWSSLGRAYVGLLAYGAIAGTFDALFETNYGFLREKPAVATLFDALGPWPWYIVSAAGLALAMFALFHLPWAIADALRKRGPGIARS